jgi:hypothetical protein
VRFLIFVAILFAVGLFLYRRRSFVEKSPAAQLTTGQIKQAWRELGFFCELDDRDRTWTLTGSREGLLRFRDLLLAYVADPRHALQSEYEQYGPYGSLEVMTWPAAGFDGQSIRGSLPDLARLAGLVETKLAAAQPDSVLLIREEFAPDSAYTLRLDVRDDWFDPASADPDRLGAATKLPAPKTKG